MWNSGLGLNPSTASYCVTFYNRSTSLSLSFLNCRREITTLHEVIAQMRQHIDDFSPSNQAQTEVAPVTFLSVGL